MFGSRLLLVTMCVGLIQHKKTKRDPSAGSDEQCLHTRRPGHGRCRGRAHHLTTAAASGCSLVLVLMLVSMAGSTWSMTNRQPVRGEKKSFEENLLV